MVGTLFEMPNTFSALANVQLGRLRIGARVEPRKAGEMTARAGRAISPTEGVYISSSALVSRNT